MQIVMMRRRCAGDGVTKLKPHLVCRVFPVIASQGATHFQHCVNLGVTSPNGVGGPENGHPARGRGARASSCPSYERMNPSNNRLNSSAWLALKP